MSPLHHERWAGGNTVSPGLAQLSLLPFGIMQEIAPRITVRQRAAKRDARPFGPLLGRKQPEIARRPGRGLQVVDPVELSVGKHAAQPPCRPQIPPGRSWVHQNVVEIGKGPQPAGKPGAGQHTDPGRRMMLADRGKSGERQDDVAKRSKLDHQNVLHAGIGRSGIICGHRINPEHAVPHRRIARHTPPMPCAHHDA